jgi:uncharacterized membrane protein
MLLLLQIKITYVQLFLIGLAVGAVLGLIPLIFGIYKKNTKLALLGFVCSILGGAISSIVSLIVVIVFVWLIFKKKETVDVNDVNEDPNNVNAGNE